MASRLYTTAAAALLLLLLLLLGLLVDDASSHVEVPATLQRLAGLAKARSNGVNINRHIDNNIVYIRNGLKAFDPRDLRDIKRTLTRKIYTLLHAGWLRHLSELRRSGDCLLQYNNRVLTLDLNFEWDQLLFNYRYLIKFLLLEERGDLYGRMEKIKINIVLDVDLKNRLIILKRLKFKDADRVKIWIKGKVFEKVYNLFFNAVTKVAKRAVLNLIQRTSVELINLDIDDLNEILGKYHLPSFSFVNLADMDLDDSA